MNTRPMLQAGLHDLRTAMAVLMTAALDSLAASDGSPAFTDQPDYDGWNRYGQREFGARKRDSWSMPAAVSTLGWLDRFPGMRLVREAITADPVLSRRADCSVGISSSMQSRPLEWLLVKELLARMVAKERAFRFDPGSFGEAYERLEAGLYATHVRMVEFLPLNALRVSSDVKRVLLDGDVVLEPMSDGQMSWAIGRGAVPAEFTGGPQFVSVEPDHQWALTRTRPCPILSADERPETPAAPDFPALLEPGQRLVTALRIVCGGSVVSTRTIWQQHEADFPILDGGTTVLTAQAAVDYTRPTWLSGDNLRDLVAVYKGLGAATVMADALLQRALRRLVLAGAHRKPEDRLADLMTCGEVIFIHRMGLGRTRTKRELIAAGADDLLRADAGVSAEPERIRRLMAEAYGVRNGRIHGDAPVGGSFVLLDGSTTSDVGRMVDHVERVIRRCLQLIVGGREPHPAPQVSSQPSGQLARRERSGHRRQRPGRGGADLTDQVER
jgi:hypothetical protein